MRNVDEFTDEVFRRKDVQVVKQKERRQAVHRKVTALVTVLAIVLTVGAVGVGAAVLSGSDWFANLYKRETHGELSESQLQYLADNTVDIQQTVTSDGITMTLGAVNCNREIFDVYIHAVAPEGVSLEGVNMSNMTFTKEDGQEVNCSSMTAYYVKDDDGRENTRTYAFRFSSPLVVDGVFENIEYIFSQGGPMKMTINGLDYAGERVFSVGEWSFDLTFTEIDEGEKTIITEPVVIDSYAWGIDVYMGKAKINTLTMYGMYGTGTYEIAEQEFKIGETVGEENRGYPYNGDLHVDVQVFFKDGTTATSSSSEYRDTDGDGVIEFKVGFSEPIILSEIDYVIIGGPRDENENLTDGVKVDVP